MDVRQAPVSSTTTPSKPPPRPTTAPASASVPDLPLSSPASVPAYETPLALDVLEPDVGELQLAPAPAPADEGDFDLAVSAPPAEPEVVRVSMMIEAAADDDSMDEEVEDISFGRKLVMYLAACMPGIREPAIWVIMTLAAVLAAFLATFVPRALEESEIAGAAIFSTLSLIVWGMGCLYFCTGMIQGPQDAILDMDGRWSFYLFIVVAPFLIAASAHIMINGASVSL